MNRMVKTFIWPCDHGGVRVEENIPPHIRCAQCGAEPVEYVLASRGVDLTVAGDGLQSAASRMADWIRSNGPTKYGRDLPYEVYMAAVEAQDYVKDWTAARIATEGPQDG